MSHPTLIVNGNECISKLCKTFKSIAPVGSGLDALLPRKMQ